LCFVVLVGWCIVVVLSVVLRRDVFHWDESTYAYRALLLSDDLKTGNLLSFLGRSTSDEFMTYGFLHAYVLSPVFLIFGPGFAVARTLSVLLMVGTGTTVFVLCSALDKRAGAVAGLVAVLALLSSPEMITWHSENMLEPLAVLLSVVCVALYVLSRGSQRAWLHSLTGLTLALLFFTKHNYGVLAVAGIGLDALVSLGLAAARRQPGELRREIWSYLLLGCSAALPVLVWVRAASFWRVYDLAHWETIDAFVGYDFGNHPYSERAFGYLKTLGVSYLAAPALGWFVLLALILSFTLIDRRLRALALVVVANLLLIPTNEVTQPRYLIATVPALLALAAIVPLRMLRQSTFHRAAAVVLLVGSAIGFVASWQDVVRVPARVLAGTPSRVYVWRDATGGTTLNLVDAIEFARLRVPLNHSVATMVRLGFLSPYTWKLEFHDWGAPVWTSNEFDDPKMPTAEYFVALDFGEAFPYQEDIQSENRAADSKLWSEYLAARAREGSVIVEAAGDFAAVATKVIVYRNIGATNVPLPEFLPPMKL
jgi:hypothetical protein